MPSSVLQLTGQSRGPYRLLSLLSEISPQVQFPETEQGVSEEKPRIKDNPSPTPATARRRLGTCSTRPEPASTVTQGQYLGLFQACLCNPE